VNSGGYLFPHCFRTQLRFCNVFPAQSLLKILVYELQNLTAQKPVARMRPRLTSIGNGPAITIRKETKWDRRERE
jgi:hypothetical protein